MPAQSPFTRRVAASAATPVPMSPEPKPEAVHVFAGAPDDRQSAEVDAPVSRFRPTYRALMPSEKALHDALKSKAAELEALIQKVGPGRYTSLALTALEEAVIWSVKQLTS